MPNPSAQRLAVAAACFLVACGFLAGTSAGSSPRSSHATAPKLLVHDTSGFSATRKRTARTRRTALSFAVYNDSALSSPSVVNESGDMGITQYVAVFNGRFDVDSRTGPRVAQVTNANFWSGLTVPDAAGLCATDPQGQPSVAYDRAADRWVISEAAYAVDGSGNPIAPYVQCVAVSTSPDATGTWSRYVFQVSSTLFPDRDARRRRRGTSTSRT